ncbi:hypothetical protein GCM10027162_22600 [Streptomyces incanus]
MPCVFVDDVDARVGCGGGHVHPDVGVDGSVLNGVAHQVAQCLLQAGRIAHDGRDG